MARKLREIFSLTAAKHVLYLPKILLKVKNFLPFLVTYAGFSNSGKTFCFRNGMKIKTDEGVDSSTIAVVFIKNDYGSINDNSVVIDIGANIGVFSVYAASSKGTKVYSYEPMPKSYESLLENIRINGLEKRIIPFNLGIGAEKGERKLFLSESSPFHSLYHNKGRDYVGIKCITLKDVFARNKIRKCSLLKIDCEGAEYEILYNTPKECLERIEKIRLEYHNLGEKEDYNVMRLISFLRSKGFRVASFRKDNEHSGNLWMEKVN